MCQGNSTDTPFPAEIILTGWTVLRVSCTHMILFTFQFLSTNNVFKEDSFKILDRFVELGGNFIDISNAYSEGQWEEIIGEWMKEWVLILKMITTMLLLIFQTYINRLRKSNTRSQSLNETSFIRSSYLSCLVNTLTSWRKKNDYRKCQSNITTSNYLLALNVM